MNLLIHRLSNKLVRRNFSYFISFENKSNRNNYNNDMIVHLFISIPQATADSCTAALLQFEVDRDSVYKQYLMIVFKCALA